MKRRLSKVALAVGGIKEQIEQILIDIDLEINNESTTMGIVHSGFQRATHHTPDVSSKL